VGRVPQNITIYYKKHSSWFFLSYSALVHSLAAAWGYFCSEITALGYSPLVSNTTNQYFFLLSIFSFKSKYCFDIFIKAHFENNYIQASGVVQ